MTMTYLEILGWARKGVIAEKENYRQMQEKLWRVRRTT